MLGFSSFSPNSYDFGKNNEENLSPSTQRFINLLETLENFNESYDTKIFDFIEENDECEKSLDSTLPNSQVNPEMVTLETERKVKIQISSSFYRYRVIKTIGKGGYSAVLLVLNEEINELFAAKICPIDELEKSDESQFAINEIEILRSINHPNIIKYYDSFYLPSTHDGNKYLVIITEYCEYGSLSSYINTNDLSESLINEILFRVSNAIEYLHSQGISYGDIKPDNILLTEDLIPKLCDFGFSKRCEISNDTNKHCTIVYAPPELLKRGPYNPQQSDIWSLGITFYTIKNHKLPFLPGTSVRNQILRGKIKLNLNDAFEKLVSKCIKKDPKERLTISEVLQDDFFKAFFLNANF